MQIIHYLQYLFLRALVLIVNLLPYSVAVAIGKEIGSFLFLILKSRREIAMNNLRAAYPEKSEDELNQIAKSAFHNMTQVAIEAVCIPKLFRKNMIKTRHAEHVWKALEKGKGVIFTVSHITNWEVMAVASGAEKFPVYAIGRPLKNKYIYDFIKKTRASTGMGNIDKSGAIKETAKLLKKNSVVAFLVDQHERQGAVKVNFFGRPCFTTSIPARIAVKWGAVVIPVSCERDQNGIVTTVYNEPVQLVNTGDEEKDAETNTQLFLNEIEKHVRQMPGNWLWMHRRWRV